MTRARLILMSKWAASLGVGVSVGAAAAWLLTGPNVRLPERFGAWRTSAHLGNTGDNLYVRASISRIAWFSNDPGRSLYLEAREDSTGRTLNIHCNYRVSGTPLPAQWWSVTAYRNFHWYPNPMQRYSYSSSDLPASHTGRWQILIGPKREPGNWIPMGGSGRMSLLLRLYDPSILNPGAISLPRIEETGCS